MAKATKVTSTTMAKAPGRGGNKSIVITTGSVRLQQRVRGQNKTGLGKPQP